MIKKISLYITHLKWPRFYKSAVSFSEYQIVGQNVVGNTVGIPDDDELLGSNAKIVELLSLNKLIHLIAQLHTMKLGYANK